MISAKKKMFLQRYSLPKGLLVILVSILVLSAGGLFAQVSTVDAPAAQSGSGHLSVGIVVDNSGSYRMIFDRVVTSTNAIIQDVRPGDEGFLLTFVDATKIVLRQEMTRDKQDLTDAADNMFVEGGQTAVLDAVAHAAKYLIQHGSGDADRSRVLILITDGDDRGSTSSVEDAIKIAREGKVRIFVLGLYEEKFYSKVVDRLVKETGGAKFVPRTPKETAAAVANILAAIRSK